MIIGQPKTLADLKLLSAEEIVQMAASVDPLLTSGQPIDMPALGLSIIDYGRIAATLKNLSTEIAHLRTLLPPVVEEVASEVPADRVGDLMSRFKLP